MRNKDGRFYQIYLIGVHIRANRKTSLHHKLNKKFRKGSKNLV